MENTFLKKFTTAASNGHGARGDAAKELLRDFQGRGFDISDAGAISHANNRFHSEPLQSAGKKFARSYEMAVSRKKKD